MKIALLGAPASGKTVYWSALYHEFQHNSAIPPLTAAIERSYRERGVANRVGFRIHIPEGTLLDELRHNSRGLDQRPIKPTDWPLSTDRLNKAKCEVKFDFVPVDADPDDDDDRARTYDRKISIFDPSGGAFIGRAEDSASIIKSLKRCDAAIVFLPMDAIVAAVEGDEISESGLRRFDKESALASITNLLEKMSRAKREDEIFPVCFVVSKADLCFEEHYEKVEDFLYSPKYGLIRRLSASNPDFMICVCPISVLDPEEQVFRAMNLEWPFLFAAAATIFRNHSELMEKADKDKKTAKALERVAKEYEDEARYQDRQADRLSSGSWWGRVKAWWGGDTVGSYTRKANSKRREAAGELEVARSYRDAAGRKIEFAKDDKRLAKDTWSSLSAEGDERRIRVFLDGERINDISSHMG